MIMIVKTLGSQMGFPAAAEKGGETVCTTVAILISTRLLYDSLGTTINRKAVFTRVRSGPK